MNEPKSKKPKCDFCDSDIAGRWRYPAKDIRLDIDGIKSTSLGDWCACEECHLLLQRGDRRGLKERAVLLLIGKHSFLFGQPRMRAEIERSVSHSHARFFEARIDGPVRREP